MDRLSFQNIVAIPLVHGRLAFALAVRERLLAERFDAIAIELPPSHRAAMAAGIDALPRIGAVFSGDRPTFLLKDDAFIGYVPIDPADGIIEALRIAEGERIPVHFIDAEVDEPEPRPLVLPDAHALLGLGLEPWYQAVLPMIARLRRVNRTDEVREAHMAARLLELSAGAKPPRILFLCGIAHWEGILAHLSARSARRAAQEDPPLWVRYEPLHARSLPHVLSEMPGLVHAFEQHRKGLALDAFDAPRALKEILLRARDLHVLRFRDSMERPSLERLQKLLDFARKLTVVQGRLIPDAYTLAVAGKGTVGPEFTLALLALLQHYPPNGRPDLDDDEEAGSGDVPESSSEGSDPIVMTAGQADFDGQERRVTPRRPGEAQEIKPLKLPRRPPRPERARWRSGWDPSTHCSWPPEDTAIENFRDYVSKRALALAGLGLVRTEPFVSSLKDGLALRETLRDWHRKKIHVKEEPRVRGKVGALVMIFEEDDDGTRFPWRTTWQAEHEEESTLAFYATDPLREMIGPGIGRMHYGGCLFLFPPIPIADVWDDLLFERARTPSERLLLAAIIYGRERYIVHVAKKPAADEVKSEARRFGKHVLHIPLDSFGPSTLERLRRAHVLNGRVVRTWAGRFIP